MLDLNTLLPGGSGWTLVSGNAINDAGQITGYGINPSGAHHAFLLSPPASTQTPAQMVMSLIASVRAMNISKMGTNLTDQLQQIETDITVQNGLACGDLNAFANQVKAQTGKSIKTADAQKLLAAVASIESALNCAP
jgi:hypothetical protein